MAQIELNERIFLVAKQRAASAGFATVDEYIADFVVHDSDQNSDDLDHLFTPERLAIIDKTRANIAAGSFHTSEQANAELAKHREEWLRKNHS